MRRIHLFVRPDAWWVGVQVAPSVRYRCWLMVQPLPCVGLAVGWGSS